MSAIAGFFICLLLFSAVLVPGIIMISQGNRHDINSLKIAGWCTVGSISLVATVGTFYLLYQWSSSVAGFLLFSAPFLIIAGLIFTLVFGIYNLANGYTRDKNGNFSNKGNIIAGWILVGVNIGIVGSVFILILLLTTGIIPIGFM